MLAELALNMYKVIHLKFYITWQVGFDAYLYSEILGFLLRFGFPLYMTRPRYLILYPRGLVKVEYLVIILGYLFISS